MHVKGKRPNFMFIVLLVIESILSWRNSWRFLGKAIVMENVISYIWRLPSKFESKFLSLVLIHLISLVKNSQLPLLIGLFRGKFKLAIGN